MYCGLDYPVRNGIPDFIAEDLSKSPHPVLRLVSRIDRLAKIYETPLWYPLVYHFWRVVHTTRQEEVKMITEMADAENGKQRKAEERVLHNSRQNRQVF
jgi:hypothetical protein